VPEITARSEIRLGRGAIRLLDEPQYLACTCFFERATDLHVAEARFRRGRSDAEERQVSRGGGVDGAIDRFGKSRRVFDQVIGWQYEQDRVLAELACRMQR